MIPLATVNLVLLALAVGWLGMLLLPGHRAVRVRNAFMLRRGTREDFEWIPGNVPAAFRLERAPAPAAIVEAVHAMRMTELGDDWERGLALQAMLISHARDDGRIAADLATTYRHIQLGSGYCADYVRVYLAAASTADLFCRQWAFSFDGFGGHGHTFVELYDRSRSQWAFLDVHNNVYAVLKGGQTPLGALALRHVLLAAPENVEFRVASRGRIGYSDPAKLVDYYRRGAREWYLVFGNDVAAREQRGIARLLAPLSGRLAHRLGSAVVGLPPLVALVTSDNQSAIARMESLRRQILWALALVVGLSGTLFLQWAVVPGGASRG